MLHLRSEVALSLALALASARRSVCGRAAWFWIRDTVSMLLSQGKQAGVLERGNAMADAREVLVIRRESHEGRNTGLTNEHRGIPTLVAWSDQKGTTLAKEQKLSTGRL